MSERATLVTAGGRTKTRDEVFPFRGLWSDGGICRLRIFEAKEMIPVIVVTELAENTNTSVTNLAEVLAAEVLARFFPERFDEPAVCIWLEHYPGSCDPHRRVREPDRVDRVEFASWIPRPCWLGGVQRKTLGVPEWHPMTAQQVADLIGADALKE